MVSHQTIMTIGILVICGATVIGFIRNARRRKIVKAPPTVLDREKAIEMAAVMQDRFSQVIYMKVYGIKEEELMILVEIPGPVPILVILAIPPPTVKEEPAEPALFHKIPKRNCKYPGEAHQYEPGRGQDGC